METWIRLAIFALILLSFLRRIVKARSRPGVPTPTRQAPDVKNQAPPVFVRPASGRKNDFRDVPPPPENPELG
ncbi:MAG: hypothetical protein WAL71_05595 [Terriglobales bacterium]|jgi:hypothetical protein